MSTAGQFSGNSFSDRSSDAELACKTFQVVRNLSPVVRQGGLKKTYLSEKPFWKKNTRMKGNLTEKSVNVRSRLDSQYIQNEKRTVGRPKGGQ